MKDLALSLPKFGTVDDPPGLLFTGASATLGSLISSLFDIILYLAAFLAFFWLIWGAYQYILARGEKENLHKARSRIIWAIVGLVVIFLAYFAVKFGSEIFPPDRGGVPF